MQDISNISSQPRDSLCLYTCTHISHTHIHTYTYAHTHTRKSYKRTTSGAAFPARRLHAAKWFVVQTTHSRQHDPSEEGLGRIVIRYPRQKKEEEINPFDPQCRCTSWRSRHGSIATWVEYVPFIEDAEGLVYSNYFFVPSNLTLDLR